jgi:TonB family protein
MDLLRWARTILDKDALILLIVLLMHLMVLIAASLYPLAKPDFLSREILAANLLVDSIDRHMPPVPQKTLGSSLSSKDSKVAVPPVSAASNPETGVPSSSLMSKDIQSREKFANPRPPYPLASRRLGEQGAVDLQLCLSQQGHVESVVVIKSSGYGRLDQSALETIKTWKFLALEVMKAPVSDCYRLPIYFRLEA